MAKIKDFEIVIQATFSSLNVDDTIVPASNKHVLSAINGFENSKWRYQEFDNFVWNNIAETALSVEERNKLVGDIHTTLYEAAKSLRLTDAEADDKGKGSELAEIFLYGIMRQHYGALPVVPKIFTKQNSQDNAKGADSVHIVVEGEKFSIWMGEAKFYNEIEDVRLGSIINSVQNALHPDKLKRENSAITGLRDLDTLVESDDVKHAIRELLDRRKSTDNLKPHLHVPILLLHECKLTGACSSLNEEYREKVREYHTQRATSYFRKQAAQLGSSVSLYNQINFHVILFPVPNKKTIIDRFVKNVLHYKNSEE